MKFCTYIDTCVCLFTKSSIIFHCRKWFSGNGPSPRPSTTSNFWAPGLLRAWYVRKIEKTISENKKIKNSFANVHTCLLRICNFLLNNKMIGKVYKKDKNPAQIQQQKRNPVFYMCIFPFSCTPYMNLYFDKI